jgi:hypothetical protein
MYANRRHQSKPKTITDHAGKCRKFWIYNVEKVLLTQNTGRTINRAACMPAIINWLSR